MDFWRQQGIVTPEVLPPVTVIGAGGIGSFTLLALAKMGCTNLTVYDDDKVEDHNLPNQLYGPFHKGHTKVNAAYEICYNLAAVNVTQVGSKFSGVVDNGVVVSGVDSMEARKEIWLMLKMKPAVTLYIEARMGAEVSRIYSVNPTDPSDIEYYEGMLYDDKYAIEAPCTERAIIYNGFSIAALIANNVKKFAKREEVPLEIIFDLKTLTLITNWRE